MHYLLLKIFNIDSKRNLSFKNNIRNSCIRLLSQEMNNIKIKLTIRKIKYYL